MLTVCRRRYILFSMIYVKNQIASSSVIGADAKLSYIGLFDVVEDAITECMGELHLDGVTVKREYNAFWVFTKNKIKLFDALVWGEKFTVESFVSSLSPAKMTVDTALIKTDGTLAAYSSCEMCVLDLTTGRIRRTSTVGIDDSFVVEKPRCAMSFERIDTDGLPQADEAVVRSTNVDYSRHCNNVEYLRFLFNTYSVEELTQLNVREIEVCYVAQAYEGDRLCIHKGVFDGCDVFSVRKDNVEIVKCLISR